MRLEGKVALIAGAGGRQGTTVALLFAREGARVALAGRAAGDVERLAAAIAAGGGQAVALAADLGNPDDAEAAVRLAVERFGRLDVLYNNTGIYTAWERRTDETTDDDWGQLLRVDLTSHFLTARAALRVQKRQGGGCVLNVAAARPARLGGNIGYAAAKSAIIGMTKKMAREYAADNVRVNCLCPTNIQASPSPDHPGLPRPLLRRDGTPEDVAWAALFLASDEAAWITGAALVIDGGAEVQG